MRSPIKTAIFKWPFLLLTVIASQKPHKISKCRMTITIVAIAAGPGVAVQVLSVKTNGIMISGIRTIIRMTRPPPI